MPRSFANDPAPWKVLSSEYVSRKFWYTVRREQVQLPNGTVIPEYWINEYRPWVNVVAVTERDEVLMVRQYRHGSGTIHFEIPAGTTDAEDTDIESAGRRELLEETGYGGGRWSPLMTLSANPALQNNLTFIAGQQANPDAQSAARIANRQAVVDLIQQRRQVAGCTANVAANNGQAAAAPGNSGNAPGNSGNAPGKAQAPGQQKKQEQPAAGDQAASGAVGEDVCPGSTVTLSGEGGAPAASSNQFPAGTKLKVTNLDNSKSTTVEVTSVSGSCTLLNNAAFEEVREPGKFLIRRARIERVG